MGAPLLGVRESFLGCTWVNRLDAESARLAEAMAQSHGFSDVLSRVLAGRGVAPAEGARFLEPRLRDLLPDPASLIDMEPAVARLASAVRRGEQVALFGDYDVDGACSAALMAQFLGACGLAPRIHIPDRLTEGYGPNIPAIRALAEAGTQLLVCLDCGTTSAGPLAEARGLGMDVLVIDHHQAGEVLPEVAALVNPNRQDDLSGLGALCAAGVTFVVLVGLARRLRAEGVPVPDLFELLDLVALATVADVVPLTGLNRAFVRQGLRLARERGRPGLAALFDVAGLRGPPEAWHFGFLVGPRVNAGGRIGDASIGARLLLTRNPDEARRLAEQLDLLNRERQAVEQAMAEAAEAQALEQIGRDDRRPLLVTADPRWHPGVVGIVAGRLKERFHRPAFALAINEDGTATGSGRSVPGVDLGRAVRAAVAAGIASKGGGHAMAAGVTLPAGGLPAFTAFLSAAFGAEASVALSARQLMIDATLTAASLRPGLVEDLARAGPFGQGHPEPVLMLAGHRLTDVAAVGSEHVRLTLQDHAGARQGAIAFRALNRPLGERLFAARGETIHAAGHVSLDRWGQTARVEFRLIDAAPQRPPGGASS